MDNNFRTMPKMMPNRMGLSEALGQYGTMKKAQPRQDVGIGRFEQAQPPVMQQQPAFLNPKPSQPLPQFQPMPQMRAPSMPLPKPSPLFNSAGSRAQAGGLLGLGQNQIRNMPKRRF